MQTHGLLLAITLAGLVLLVLLAALIAWPFGYGCLVIQAYLTIFRLLGCLSGLKIDVESGDGNFFIKLV